MSQHTPEARPEMSTPEATARPLVGQVREMLKREAYHYCADCKTHCRQLILTVEALKELEREFKVLDDIRVTESCASHGGNVAVCYVGAECPLCNALDALDANKAHSTLVEALKEINHIANMGYANHAQQDKDRIAEISHAALIAAESTEQKGAEVA